MNVLFLTFSITNYMNIFNWYIVTIFFMLLLQYFKTKKKVLKMTYTLLI
jgi:hypothetical protein